MARALAGGRWAVRCALLLALVALASCTRHYPDKRSEQSRPFVMGSRYGRSGAAVAVAPRNERFFMGSRYGKRSPAAAAAGALSCQYTGLYRLYRCSRGATARRSSEVPNISDEILGEDLKDVK